MKEPSSQTTTQCCLSPFQLMYCSSTGCLPTPVPGSIPPPPSGTPPCSPVPGAAAGARSPRCITHGLSCLRRKPGGRQEVEANHTLFIVHSFTNVQNENQTIKKKNLRGLLLSAVLMPRACTWALHPSARASLGFEGLSPHYD